MYKKLLSLVVIASSQLAFAAADEETPTQKALIHVGTVQEFLAVCGGKTEFITSVDDISYKATFSQEALERLAKFNEPENTWLSLDNSPAAASMTWKFAGVFLEPSFRFDVTLTRQ